MARKRAARIVVLFIIGALVAVGTGVAYRAFMAPWRGDVREPLIAAAFVGVAYFPPTLHDSISICPGNCESVDSPVMPPELRFRKVSIAMV